jgi:BlaI family penicillinase repressor
MEPPNISESEWTVMEALWEASPLTASEVAKALGPAHGWADNTIRTMLTRLVNKGAIEIREVAGSPKQFAPAVMRDDCVRAESESFLKRIFRGSSKPLLLHFSRDASLTPEEVRELKQLLDESIRSNDSH